MYKTIYIPVDNSDYSNMAVDLGVSLAKSFGSKIVGSHVYAAKMHDKRFKQMEAGLPEEYHDEKELDRQRQIHDSLITRGLQIITDSYLDYVDKKCTEANLPLERRSLEGRNWKVLAEVGRSDSRRSRFTVRIGKYNPVTGAGGIVTVQPVTNAYINDFQRAELLGKFSTWEGSADCGRLVDR